VYKQTVAKRVLQNLAAYCTSLVELHANAKNAHVLVSCYI